jgi:branched-chain amino acid transport system permease protein
VSVRVAFASRSSHIGMAFCAAALLALTAAPLWGGRDDLQLLSEVYTYVALASLWNLLAGYAGLVSVGQQAYVGLGAYILFAFAILAGLSPLWAIPLAGIIAAIVAMPVAGLVFRLRGHYFAIGTWIVGTIVFFALRQTLADLGTIYLLTLGVVAIPVMLMPKGFWGLIVESFGWQVFPLERSVILGDRRVVSEQKSRG